MASTDSDAVLDVLVGGEDLDEPHEAPGELGLGPDGQFLQLSQKVNSSTCLGKVNHSDLVESLMANGFVTGSLDSRSYQAAML